MLPPRPSPLQRSDPCMSPTYTSSAPSSTTHREGLLRVGSSPCATTYNRTARGLRSFRASRPRECSSKAATWHQTVMCKRPPTSSNNIYRGRNCCTTNVEKAVDKLSGHDYIFLVEQPYNECQLIDILDYLLAASSYCHRGRHRYNAVIRACLQPARGLCLKADLNFCVRPSGDAFVSLGTVFLISFFQVASSSVFSNNLLTNCSSASASSEN